MKEREDITPQALRNDNVYEDENVFASLVDDLVGTIYSNMDKIKATLKKQEIGDQCTGRKRQTLTLQKEVRPLYPQLSLIL